MHVLVTRPIAQALRTKARLEALGHQVSLAPMLEIVFVAARLPQETYAAIVVTSANAIEALSAHDSAAEWRRLPIYTVGARTAETADRQGWTDIVSADGNADDLAALVTERLAGTDRPVLYACGTERAADVEGQLEASGLRVAVVEVYRARRVDVLPAAVGDSIRAGSIDLVLLYSARSAEAFVQSLQSGDLLAQAASMAFGVMSEAVAAPLHGLGPRTVTIAAHPTESALFGKLGLDDK